ncbi:MAG: FHA domain-containing protein [Phycisphaerae bacterium]
MAVLIVTSGKNSGARFELSDRPMICGREPGLDISLADPQVSRRHFEITLVDGRHHVRELQSKNGVFVNGSQVAQSRLEDGDNVQVGDTILKFRTADASPSPAPTTPEEKPRAKTKDITATQEDGFLK